MDWKPPAQNRNSLQDPNVCKVSCIQQSSPPVAETHSDCLEIRSAVLASPLLCDCSHGNENNILAPPQRRLEQRPCVHSGNDITPLFSPSSLLSASLQAPSPQTTWAVRDHCHDNCRSPMWRVIWACHQRREQSSLWSFLINIRTQRWCWDSPPDRSEKTVVMTTQSPESATEISGVA